MDTWRFKDKHGRTHERRSGHALRYAVLAYDDPAGDILFLEWVPNPTIARRELGRFLQHRVTPAYGGVFLTERVA